MTSAAGVTANRFSLSTSAAAAPQPTSVGPPAVASTDEPSPGDRFRILVSGAVQRFRSVGTVTIGDETKAKTTFFDGRHSGGGLRALPPVCSTAGDTGQSFGPRLEA
jgi:hypothetical protein